jgi:hypothetical protein
MKENSPSWFHNRNSVCALVRPIFTRSFVLRSALSNQWLAVSMKLGRKAKRLNQESRIGRSRLMSATTSLRFKVGGDAELLPYTRFL